MELAWLSAFSLCAVRLQLIKVTRPPRPCYGYGEQISATPLNSVLIRAAVLIRLWICKKFYFKIFIPQVSSYYGRGHAGAARVFPQWTGSLQPAFLSG
jgi:hypothetical protein